MNSRPSELPFTLSGFDAIFVFDLSWGNQTEERVSGIVQQASDLLKPGAMLFLGLEGYLGYLLTKRGTAHEWSDLPKLALGHLASWLRPSQSLEGLTPRDRVTRNAWLGSIAKEDRWARALSPEFWLSERFYIYPGLSKPSLVLTTPTLFRQDDELWLLRSLLGTYRRPLVRNLARTGLLESLSSRLITWEKKEQPTEQHTWAFRTDGLKLGRSAEFLSEVGSKKGETWPPEDLHFVAYTGKPKKVSEVG